MKVSPLEVEQCKGKVEQKTFPNLIFDYFYLVCFGCCFSDRCCSTASKSTEVSSLLLDPTVATAGFTASLQVFSFSAEAPTSIVNANQGRQKSSCLYILSLSLSAVKGNAFSQLISCSPTCNVQQSFSFVASGENAI